MNLFTDACHAAAAAADDDDDDDDRWLLIEVTE